MPATQTRRNRQAKAKTKGQAEPAKKVRPIDTVKAESQKSVTITFSQATRSDGSLWLPSGNGGVKFEAADGKTSFYVPQDDFVKLGRPSKVKHVITAA